MLTRVEGLIIYEDHICKIYLMPVSSERSLNTFGVLRVLIISNFYSLQIDKERQNSISVGIVTSRI